MWAGTEASLHDYIQAATNVPADARPRADAATLDAPERHPLLSVIGNIGVVSVKGSLVNKAEWWHSYAGITSYESLREAMIQAANDPEVKHVLLDIASGGGAVAGIADLGSLITRVQGIKPVTAFTDSAMYSAAYWIGAAAGDIYASNIAGVGSIGVIATHMEISKMLEEEGIKATVIRAGKYKALANQNEPLTEAARAQIQDGLDAIYTVFVQHAADARGMSYSEFDKKAAQGREFYGQQALDAGLIDGLTTFDALVSQLQENVDKPAGLSHNQRILTKGNKMPKAALTQAQIMALAASGVQVAADAAVQGAEAAVELPNNDGAAPAPAAEAPAADIGAGSGGAPAAAAPAAPAPVAPAADTNIVAFLQGEIASKDASLLAANVKVAGLEAKIADTATALSGLLTIAAASVNNMRIALGGSAVDMAAMNATQLLAEHASVQAQFQSKFKAGGVAAVDAASAAEKPVAQVDALTQARLNAVPRTSRK